ncbi:MAG: type I glyceraldehyde-3-phosphate dehydrogenase [Bdellovibrionaceae bacterium]|nr:type I glyceraldehyde-3-phosphate dehydrogenase [Pseudobdellovibrionaceae bacterium]|tara:strand:+ start:447 stop:1460 length:1014 start_codon:yes stop_codon:yes gene_type:complete
MTHQTNIGINGFGRIGRKVLRLALKDPQLKISRINDLGDIQTLAHLLKYDSAHGTLDADVRTDGNALIVNGETISVSRETDPSKLGWKDQSVQIVHECTGRFTHKKDASAHLSAGAQRIIISAPAKEPDATLCMGVNHTDYSPEKHFVISNASCTTNCLAPLVKVLDDAFGVNRGTMTTIHSYTNDQRILDLPHSDLRRARAAALSQIPTTTGAAKAVGLVLPHLSGKIDGMAVRVPTPNVSMVDFVGELNKEVNIEQVNDAFKAASEGSMKGILGYSTDPLVSIDYNGNTHSSTIDSLFTTVVTGNWVKVLSWYDNESGFSQRMLDLTRHIVQQGI